MRRQRSAAGARATGTNREPANTRTVNRKSKSYAISRARLCLALSLTRFLRCALSAVHLAVHPPDIGSVFRDAHVCDVNDLYLLTYTVLALKLENCVCILIS